MLTQGSLSALTEIIASWFAYGLPGHGPTITARVPQMAFYGACIAAPLTHFLNTTLQRSLPGRVVLQNLITMLLVRSFSSHHQFLSATYLTYYSSSPFKMLSILYQWPSLLARARLNRLALRFVPVWCP